MAVRPLLSHPRRLYSSGHRRGAAYEMPSSFVCALSPSTCPSNCSLSPCPCSSPPIVTLLFVCGVACMPGNNSFPFIIKCSLSLFICVFLLGPFRSTANYRDYLPSLFTTSSVACNLCANSKRCSCYMLQKDNYLSFYLCACVCVQESCNVNPA